MIPRRLAPLWLALLAAGCAGAGAAQPGPVSTAAGGSVADQLHRVPVVQQDGSRFVAVDPTVTPELRAEGMARELVSRTQRLRKETGLEVSDRIILKIAGPALVSGAAETHRQWIAGEVLARNIEIMDAMPAGVTSVAVELDGVSAHIALSKDS